MIGGKGTTLRLDATSSCKMEFCNCLRFLTAPNEMENNGYTALHLKGNLVEAVSFET